jgi:hypothetical protein
MAFFAGFAPGEHTIPRRQLGEGIASIPAILSEGLGSQEGPSS